MSARRAPPWPGRGAAFVVLAVTGLACALLLPRPAGHHGPGHRERDLDDRLPQEFGAAAE